LTTTLAAIWKDALQPPEALGVGAWAERNLRLSPKVSNFPGAFRVATTPYLAGVFDAFENPDVERIYLAFGAQTAKTTAMLACLCYTLANDPGPSLWVMPSEHLARDFSQDRLQPLIDESPVLAADKPTDGHRYKTLSMQMRRATVALVGANSPANLASRPIRYLWADEVDKFPVETSREGSALSLSIRRTAAYWNRKIVVSSTPSLADGAIWVVLLSGDWREYHLPCPRCGEYQVAAFDRIRKPSGLKDPDEIAEVAWLECAHCEAKIDNAPKRAMLEAGEWRPKAEPVREFDWTPREGPGRVASFHLPAWYSPWQRWGDCLARFTAAQPYPEILREVVNSDHAEPWEERGEAKREEDILAHRGEYGDGTFPSDAEVHAVLQTVDVQKDHLWYCVRGWGPHEASWLAAYGMLPDFDALAETMERVYGSVGVGRTLVDCRYRTEEVYEFCRRFGAIAVQGGGESTAPYRWSKADRTPSGKPIRGGVRVLHVNGAHWREALFRKLAIAPGDPGYWALHADVGPDYAQQLIAEILVEKKDAKGRVVRYWKQVRRRNHLGDCEVYQLAGARALGLRHVRQAAERSRAPEPESAGVVNRRRWHGIRQRRPR